MIDLTKPVQTRDGRPARIICTDRKVPSFPVGALVTESDGLEIFRAYKENGRAPGCPPGGWDDLDLVNVPEEKVRYVNVYTSGTSMHATRESAEAYCTEDCAGLLKLTIIDGKVTKAEII